LSLVAAIILAIIGFRTFGRWKREQVEGRRIEVAFDALEVAYKAKHVFDYIRGPLQDHELASMVHLSDDDEYKRCFATSLRIEANKAFFEDAWKCHTKCMSVFGPPAEAVFLELHEARRCVQIAAKTLLKEKPDCNVDLWPQLRADICGVADGQLAPEGDRVGRHVTAFREGIEKSCGPIVNRKYGSPRSG
jgi:hypothetical protein